MRGLTNLLDLHLGDCLEVLRTLPDNSVHCCVTSPPYYGLRDYGMDGQIGLEPTPDEYVARMVAVFREVRRVLRDDGTCWVNLGDSYASGGRKTRDADSKLEQRGRPADPSGIKPKDLLGIPWRVAFALQSDGWYLRQDIIWAKSNPMPESVRDRCTKAHEYIFLLTKSARYFYDCEAIKEPLTESSIQRAHRQQRLIDRTGIGSLGKQSRNGVETSHSYAGLVLARNGKTGYDLENKTRNRRSVWTVATCPYKGAHFAVFPPQLIEPCILAGCPVGGTVLDPFAGSGTTGAVSLTHDRYFIGIELNPEYLELAKQRIETAKTQPAPKPKAKRTTKPKAPDLEQRVESLEFQQRGLAAKVRRIEAAGQMSLFG